MQQHVARDGPEAETRLRRSCGRSSMRESPIICITWLSRRNFLCSVAEVSRELCSPSLSSIFMVALRSQVWAGAMGERRHRVSLSASPVHTRHLTPPQDLHAPTVDRRSIVGACSRGYRSHCGRRDHRNRRYVFEPIKPSCCMIDSGKAGTGPLHRIGERLPSGESKEQTCPRSSSHFGAHEIGHVSTNILSSVFTNHTLKVLRRPVCSAVNSGRADFRSGARQKFEGLEWIRAV